MKIKSYILGLSVIAVLLTSSTFAATTTPSTKKTIILNNQTYTLNICDAKEVDALRLKVIVWLKWKPLLTKRKIYTQVRLLQAAWMKTCPIQGTSTTIAQPQVIQSNTFTVITNPSFIDSLPSAQKNKVLERATLYTTSAEGIIDSMISQWILTSIDKTTIKGKIELNYVNDCKKIDWITTVKQWYDWSKKRVKNELVSISLNISTCEDAGYTSLFANSYKHVFIHEIWHYIYYLRDKNTKSFEDLCWDTDGKRKNACISFETYFSKYAMNDQQEDYAETFAYWYQSKQPEFVVKGSTYNLTTINMKAEHFSDMYRK